MGTGDLRERIWGKESLAMHVYRGETEQNEGREGRKESTGMTPGREEGKGRKKSEKVRSTRPMRTL